MKDEYEGYPLDVIHLLERGGEVLSVEPMQTESQGTVSGFLTELGDRLEGEDTIFNEAKGTLTLSNLSNVVESFSAQYPEFKISAVIDRDSDRVYIVRVPRAYV